MRISILGTFGGALLLLSTQAAAQPVPVSPAPAATPAPAAAPPPPAAATAPAAPSVAPAPEAAPAPLAAPAPSGPVLADLPPPPPPVPSPFAGAPTGPEAKDKPLAGYHGVFFLRDEADHFHLYPRGRVHIDSHTFAGPGVYDLPAVDGGNALMPRLFVRRLRLELAGDFLERFSFQFGAELSNQPLSNANGKTETSAGKPGQDPSASSARFAAVQTASSSAAVADAWINYRNCDCLNFQFGQYQAPFSMENRTSNNNHPWIERNLAIRSFVVPTSKETGLTVWGELGGKLLNYQVGLFGGDGQNRPQVDSRMDVMGRVFSRPFSKGKGPLAKLQLGASARYGQRDDDYVGYDYPAITSGQGWSLWSPTYKDSESRTVHVIPSGAQMAFGGELWAPLFGDHVVLQGEAYYVSNDTREGLDGYQLTNTERLGRMKGLGWYGQLSVWPSGKPLVAGEPGNTARPTHVNFDKPVKVESGLELLAIVSGIDAVYSGAVREGVPDAKTPGSTSNPAQDITVREYGVGMNYWYTRHVRLSVNYVAYHTPGSGSAENLAVVPGNVLPEEPKADAHLLHELSTRIGIMF
jgi:hypothetical protein